jgi:hypothetical protein
MTFQVRCVRVYDNLIISGSWDRTAKVCLLLKESVTLNQSVVGSQNWHMLEESGS